MGRRREFYYNKDGERKKAQWAKDRDKQKNQQAEKETNKFFARVLIHGTGLTWASTRVHPLEHLADGIGFIDYHDGGSRTLLDSTGGRNLGITDQYAADVNNQYLGDLLDGEFNTEYLLGNALYTTLEGDIIDAAIVWGPSVVYEAAVAGIAGYKAKKNADMFDAFLGAILPTEVKAPVKKAAKV